MDDPILMSVPISLGINLERTARFPKISASEVEEAVQELLGALRQLHLDHSREMAVPLEMLFPIEEMQDPRQFLDAYMDAVVRSVNIESETRRMIVLRSADVSPKLREFGMRTLTDVQSRLLDETVRCLEVGAYRSAVVMGWNLVYDYVRQWVFDHKRDELNAELTSKYKGATALNTYSDFFAKNAPSEHQILEACAGRVLGTRITDPLKTLLRERNDYAHSNFHDPTLHQANYFIEQCLKVVNGPPFL